MLGYAPDAFAFSPQALLDLTLPEQRLWLERAFGRLLSNQEEFVGEVQLKRRDQSWIWVEISGYAASETGSGLKIGGMFIDKGQASREPTQDYFDLLIAAEQVARSGSYIRNTETHAMQYSPGLLRLFDLDPHEVNADNLFSWTRSRFHPDEDQLHEEQLEKTSKGEALEDFEYRICLPNGSIRWLRHSFYRYVGDKELIGSVLDITAEKEIRLRLEAKQGQLTSLNENLEQQVAARTAELTYFIDGLEQLLRLSAMPFDDVDTALQAYLQAGTQLLGMEVAIVSRITGDDYEIVAVEPGYLELEKGQHFALSDTLCEQLIKTDETVFYSHIAQSVIRTHPAHKNMKIESYIGAPIRLEAGIMGTLNFSSLQPQPAAYLVWKKTLVEFMAQNIAAFIRLYGTQKTLQQQSEALAQTNQELEQLLYTVSHDLRAPVRHVSGYAQMLNDRAREKLNPEEREFLNNVIASAARLGRMIDELLQYSRSRNIELKKEEIDLNQLVKYNRELFAKDTDDRHIRWEISDLPKVYADRNMMDKVFLNLLSNAVKFTEKQAHPVIRISGEQTDTFVKIAVEDNGAGFDIKYQHKLFAVFQRLHKQRDFEGTGIGLANVHRIITRHQGNIWAESEEGKGAAFYFTIPELT